MGHRLSPRDGRPHLAPNEIVERLRKEFDYVTFNADTGADQVGDMISHLRRMKTDFEKRKVPPPMAIEVEKQIARLESLQSEALNIVVIDDPMNEDASFSCTAIPDEDLMIGYASGQHEEVAAPLVMRAARVLDYSTELI